MRIFQLILLVFAFTITACGEKKNQNNSATIETSVKHYICDNNCENSGGDIAGNCPTCNTPYTHNQAWHDKDFLKSGPLNVPKDESIRTDPTTPTQSPARNAKGVYHYTCSNGCAGGGASASECRVCGNTLVHNTAYHD